jgi:hypothetical protein
VVKEDDATGSSPFGGAGGEEMTGGEVHMLFRVALPQGGIDRLCAELSVIERQRKLNLGIFLRAMVSSAGMAGGIYQADVLRSYLSLRCPVSRAPLSTGASTSPANGSRRHWPIVLLHMLRRGRSICRDCSVA